MTAVQDGPTNITLSWSPPSSGATGYVIHYESQGGDRGSATVSSGSTNRHTLSSLLDGDTYTISIFTTSPVLPSASVSTQLRLGDYQLLKNIICQTCIRLLFPSLYPSSLPSLSLSFSLSPLLLPSLSPSLSPSLPPSPSLHLHSHCSSKASIQHGCNPDNRHHTVSLLGSSS